MQRVIVIFSLVLGILPVERSYAGAKWSVGKKQPAEQRVSIDQIDHSLWDVLLQEYVDSNGYVDYRSWKRDGEQQLDLYLRELSKAITSKRATKNAKLAFWINAYNAVTVKGILREYPTTSIRNHTAKVFGYNIWHDLLLIVGEEQYSLDHIEHKILRQMGEPRIHFAIVCASVGCPRLLSRAFVPTRLDEQLTANAKHFFADSSKFRIDAQQVWLSPILNWFADDFGANRAAQLRAIAPYLPSPTAQRLARNGSASVNFLDYDWDLNDQARLSQGHSKKRSQ